MDKPEKKLSSYNIFMKTEIPKVKENDPSLKHKEAFKLAASNWNKHKIKK